MAFGRREGPAPGRRPARVVSARGGTSREAPPRAPRADETVAFDVPEPAAHRGAAPARARLVDLCAEWLAMMVSLRQAAGAPDLAAVRARALEYKSRLEDDARRAGFSAADVEAATFALVGFLDESVLRLPSVRDQWMTRPLQLELYGAMVAGEEFYERLDRLRRDREARVEAIEVYYACLAFGFSGKYAMAGPERVKALLAELEADLVAVRGPARRALAPRAGRPDEAGGLVAGGVKWWWVVAGFAGGLVLTWLVLKLLGVLGAGAAAEGIRRLVR